MTKTYDFTARSGYLRFSDAPIANTKILSSQVFCDLDARCFPVGIEFINLSAEQFSSVTEKLALVQV